MAARTTFNDSVLITGKSSERSLKMSNEEKIKVLVVDDEESLLLIRKMD